MHAQATGRTGQRTAAALLEGRADLASMPLNYRATLAQIAVRRLMSPDTREGYMLTEVVCQAIRDIGRGGVNESLDAWHRGELDVFLISFGVESECVAEILDGVRLWRWHDVRPGATIIDDRPLRATSGKGRAGSGSRKLLRSL